MTKDLKKKEIIMKVFCIRCEQYTNHDIIKEYERTYTPEDIPEMGIEFAMGRWQILQCKGCEDITFRESWVTSEDWNPVTGEMEESVKLYPQRGRELLPIKSFFNVPGSLRQIYREIIDCYNSGIYTLCAAGLRAIIEGICAEQNIKDGPIVSTKKDGSTKTERGKRLQAKIEGFKERGVLTEQHCKILHEHRFLGNDAVHNLDRPSREELKLAIQIIEHTLENIYELKDRAEELRRKKKLRKRKR